MSEYRVVSAQATTYYLGGRPLYTYNFRVNNLIPPEAGAHTIIVPYDFFKIDSPYEVLHFASISHGSAGLYAFDMDETKNFTGKSKVTRTATNTFTLYYNDTEVGSISSSFAITMVVVEFTTGEVITGFQGFNNSSQDDNYVYLDDYNLEAGYFGDIAVSHQSTNWVFQIYNFGTNAFKNWCADVTGIGVINDDPFSQNQSFSGDGGGTGDFDNTSDSIDFPSLPIVSATQTGFLTLFNPTLAQLQNLATFMWTNPLFDVSAWKKIFADPMDAILGLTIIPVNVPSGAALNVSVGNIQTDVYMTRATAQYVEVDCGALNVNEYWGAYLDYAPYTKAEIYLPYCGTHAIDVDEIMGKTVAVKYHVDILSGACCAYVKCGESVLYTFVGQCGSSIPISGGDWTNMINGLISAATSIGTMVASGGSTAPTTISGLASTAINTMKPAIEKSGSITGAGGLLALQKPYIVLSRPRQALAAGQNNFIGYPSFTTVPLSTLSGYTEIEKIHLENVTATDAELSEIETLLKSGVIF